MTEQRRAALTSVTTNKKDKSSKKVSKTYRFVINLPEPTEQICPEFNFSELVKNAEKKKKDDKADSTKVQVNGLDPLEEDDQENLKAIARHYEEKYGGVKKRHGRFEDYCDLGAGYDETDPFIDNTDAYDEIVPDEMTTAHGGFYINSGALKFKEIPVTNGSDRDEVREKKRPKIKRTMTVEEGARILKKPKLDQHKKMAWIKKQALIKEQEMQKKRRRKQLAADDMARKKSATVKELLKERRGDLTSRGYPPEEPTPEPEAVVTSSNPPPVQDTVKTTVNSSIADAIESVVKASQISDDSSEEPDKPLSAPGSVKPVRSDVEECYETENKEHGTREETEVKLPDNLSEDLVKMVDVLKQAAATSSSAGKSKFFSPDVNRTLLSIEMKVHNMSGGDRQSVYGHLASYLPCTRDTLMRRAKKLVSQQSEEMVKQPLRRLKILIDEMMPTVVRNYTMDYDRAVKEKSLQEAAVAEGKSENVNKVRIPRRKFPWTPETRSLLCEIVKIKLQYFELVKTRKENTMDMLTTYLDTRIRVLWPSGWMKTNTLIQESRSVHTRSGPLQESSNIPGADTAIKDLKLQRKKYSWMDDVDERKKARKNASVNSSFLSNAVPCESRPSSSPITVQATAAALTNPSSKASKSVPMDLTMSAASTNSTSPSSKPVSVISQISDSVSITLTNVKSKNFPSEAALPSSLTVTPTTRIATTGPGISKPPVFGKSKIGDVVITKTSVSPEKPRENVISNSVSTLRTVSDTSSSIYSSPISSNPPVLSSSASKSKGIFDVNTNWTAPSPPVSKPVSSSLAHMNIPDCISVMPSYLNSSPAVPLTHSKPVTSISAISVSKPSAPQTVLKSTPSAPKSSTPSVLSSSIPPISMLPIMKPSTHSVISKTDTPLPSELTITAPSLSVSITSKPSPPIPKPGTPPSIPKSNTPPFISKPNTPPCIPKPGTPPSVIKSTSAAPVLSSTTPSLSITGSFSSGSIMKPAQSISPSLSISKPPPLPSPPKPIMNLKQRILQGSSMIPPEPPIAPKKKEKEPAEDGIDIIEIIDEDTDIEGSSKDESEVHRAQKNSGTLKHKTDSLTKKDYDMLGIADPKSYFSAGKKRDTEKHSSDDNVSNKRIGSDMCEDSASVSDAEAKRVKVGTLPTVDHNHTAAFDQQRRTIGALDAVSQIISESLSARPSSSTSHHKEEKRHNKVLPSSSSEYRDLHQHSRPSFEPSKGIEEPENLKKKSNSSSPIDVETSVQIEMDRVMKELMQLQGHMSNERTSEDTSSPTSVIACSSSAPSSSSHGKHRDRSNKQKDDQPNASSKGFQDEFQKHLLQIKDSVSATDRTERHSEFAEQAPAPMSSDQAAAYEDFSQSAVNSSNLPTPDFTYNLPPSDLDSFTGFHFMGPLLSHLADLKSVANTTQTSSSHHSTHY